MTDKTRTRGHKPAVGYTRRSTDRQEQSLGDQRKAVEVYAQEAGYELLDWYSDDAISGAGVDDRAAFLRMIQDAQQPNRPFDYILVYDVKRFGRLDNDENPRIEALERAAGTQVDLDQAVREMTSMLGSFAEVMQEGSTDERRRVIRAFVREVRLDPQTHEGRAEIFALPDFEAVTRYQATASRSSAHPTQAIMGR